MKALEILNVLSEHGAITCQPVYAFEAISELEALQQQNTALQARIKQLEEKPNCCTYHSDNLPINYKCGNCDYLDCIHFPKD